MFGSLIDGLQWLAWGSNGWGPGFETGSDIADGGIELFGAIFGVFGDVLDTVEDFIGS